MQKICDNCKRTFSTNRADQRFCSGECRTEWHNHHDPNRSYAAYMERKKQAAIRYKARARQDEQRKKEQAIQDEQRKKEQILDSLLAVLRI